jgi:predicted metal-dependent peptidase
MDRELLAKALGAIASYSISRNVPIVRVVFCDAFADSVKVKGRGGTILQPAIDMIEKTEDIPAKGPILIITDCQCDKLVIHRDHAFLIPQGKNLPFVPRGEVFRFS